MAVSRGGENFELDTLGARGARLSCLDAWGPASHALGLVGPGGEAPRGIYARRAASPPLVLAPYINTVPMPRAHRGYIALTTLGTLP